MNVLLKFAQPKSTTVIDLQWMKHKLELELAIDLHVFDRNQYNTKIIRTKSPRGQTPRQLNIKLHHVYIAKCILKLTSPLNEVTVPRPASGSLL